MQQNYERNLHFIIHRLHWAIHQAVNRVFRESGMDITMDQFLLMGYLWNNDGISQAGLAELTGKDKAGIARLLGQLSRKGLIRRETDAADKRLKRVWVTPQGQAIHQSCQRHGNRSRKSAEKGIGQQDMKTTLRTLERILENIKMNEK